MVNIKQIVIRTAQNGKDSIGIKLGKDSDEFSEIIVPRYFMPDMDKKVEELTKEDKRKLKTLVKAWKKYQSRVRTKNNGELKGEGINFDFDVALCLVQDFLEYGLYIEFEKIEIKGNNGKIDFPRTIKKCRPIVFDEGPLYLPYITKTKKIADENLVRNVQILVLNDISKKIGWLLGFNIQFPQIGMKEKISSSLIPRLKMAKNNSYNTRKLNLINYLMDYISMDSIGGTEDNKNLFVSVVNKFWEDVISEILGNVDHNTLNKIFYVRHRYINKETGIIYKLAQQLNPLMPDAVLDQSGEIVVIDAKYYDKRYLPENNDITKQFAYMRKAFGYYGTTRQYRNVFVLPTDEHYHYSNKQAVFDLDIAMTDDLIPINVLYLNVSEAVDYYISSTNISSLVF